MSQLLKSCICGSISKLRIDIFIRPNRFSRKCMSSRKKFPAVHDRSYDNDLSSEFFEDRLEGKINQHFPNKLRTERNLGRKTALREAEKQHRQFIKWKIIEKKEKALFEPRQPNLLTWAAQCQIKHLNKTDPHNWTPEMLAESFPVTKEAIVKILRSSRVPYDQQEIFKHDQKVYKNWLQLKKAKKMLASGGPVDPKFMHLLESEKLSQMKHAAGCKGLPMPDNPGQFVTLKAIAKSREPKVKSVFSAILEDYKRDKDTVKKDEEIEHIDIEDPKYLPLLEELSENTDALSYVGKTETELRSTDKNSKDSDIDSDLEDENLDIDSLLDSDLDILDENMYLNNGQYASKQFSNSLSKRR